MAWTTYRDPVIRAWCNVTFAEAYSRLPTEGVHLEPVIALLHSVAKFCRCAPLGARQTHARRAHHDADCLMRRGHRATHIRSESLPEVMGFRLDHGGIDPRRIHRPRTRVQRP